MRNLVTLLAAVTPHINAQPVVSAARRSQTPRFLPATLSRFMVACMSFPSALRLH
jgi:hypothetical protein